MTSSHTRVRHARRHAKLSQQDLATLVGVHRSAVSQWEKQGGSSPTVDNLARIAISTAVQFEWLATGRGLMVFASDLLADPSPAVLLNYCAHNEVEARALAAFRKLDQTDVVAIVEMAEALARRRKVSLKRAIPHSLVAECERRRENRRARFWPKPDTQREIAPRSSVRI